MTLRILAKVLITLIAALIPSALAAGSASCQDLLEQLADSSRAVQSLSVTYISGDMSIRNPDLPKGSHLRREIAAARPGNYMHWSFHPHDDLTWQNDPLQQRLFVSSSQWYNVNPVKNSFASAAIDPAEGLPGSAPYELLFFSTGIWPLDRPAPTFKTNQVYLHELPACAGQFVFFSEEKISGVECLVIGRPGVDRIWLDKLRATAVMAREFCDPSDGRLLQRFEFLDHEEVIPGTWFPRRIRNLLVTGADLSRPESFRDSVIQILELRVNQDESDGFHWEPGPGALDITRPNQPKQVLTGGTELLDNYRTFADLSQTESTPWTDVICIAAAFLSMFACGFFLPVIFDRRRAKQKS